MRLTIDAALGLIRRDLLTFMSYRTQIVSITVGVLVNLTLYYYLSRLVSVQTFRSPDDYFAFVVIGMVILQVLQSTIAVASVLRAELVAGTFERLVLSPFGAVRGMLSMMLFPFLIALVSAVILLLCATLIFGVPIKVETAPLAIPVAILGTGVFTSFGMFFAASTLVFKRAVTGLGLVITLITLTSGLYFPVALLPGYLQWISSVQPFTPAVDLLRNVLVGTPLQDPLALELARMAGFLVLMLPLGWAALYGGLRLAQRRGTIIEY